MGPFLTTVQQAEQAFADPAKRQQVQAWLQDGVPFLEMVDRFGFSNTVDDNLRAAIEGLSPDEVAIISNAFLASIERAGPTGPAAMPIDCNIDVVTGSVAVTSIEVDRQPRARILHIG